MHVALWKLHCSSPVSSAGSGVESWVTEIQSGELHLENSKTRAMWASMALKGKQATTLTGTHTRLTPSEGRPQVHTRTHTHTHAPPQGSRVGKPALAFRCGHTSLLSPEPRVGLTQPVSTGGARWVLTRGQRWATRSGPRPTASGRETRALSTCRESRALFCTPG